MYEFEIKEINNGWLLHRTPVLSNREFFPTLNALFDELLRYVHEDSPEHRNTAGVVVTPEAHNLGDSGATPDPATEEKTPDAWAAIDKVLDENESKEDIWQAFERIRKEHGNPSLGISYQIPPNIEEEIRKAFNAGYYLCLDSTMSVKDAWKYYRKTLLKP